MRISGLQKGGLYRHFESRDALALEAFEFGGRQSAEPVPPGHCALFDVARHAPSEEAFYGGCPVMNLAVESDDADPKLRNAARKAMRQVIALFEEVIAEGIKQGEFPEGDARKR